MSKINFKREMKNWLATLVCIFMLTNLSQNSFGQERPPRPIKVSLSNAQGIVFGTFAHGPTGGWISVSPAGDRSSGGSVVLINRGNVVSPAIFLVEGIKGTMITLSPILDATLRGSAGGTMRLTFDPPNIACSTGSPFILKTDSPATQEVRIGGKLLVGDSGANPAGNYSGTFAVTFNQQ